MWKRCIYRSWLLSELCQYSAHGQTAYQCLMIFFQALQYWCVVSLASQVKLLLIIQGFNLKEREQSMSFECNLQDQKPKNKYNYLKLINIFF